MLRQLISLFNARAPDYSAANISAIFLCFITFSAGSLDAQHNFSSWNSRCNKPCGDRESPSQ